jgi:hypothetical protein
VSAPTRPEDLGRQERLANSRVGGAAVDAGLLSALDRGKDVDDPLLLVEWVARQFAAHTHESGKLANERLADRAGVFDQLFFGDDPE